MSYKKPKAYELRDKNKKVIFTLEEAEGLEAMNISMPADEILISREWAAEVGQHLLDFSRGEFGKSMMKMPTWIGKEPIL